MGASIIYVCKCECISVASVAAVVVEYLKLWATLRRAVLLALFNFNSLF
jgi:hypothetical protein